MADPKLDDTYLKIASRLASLTPAVQIEKYIDSDLTVGRNTLQGVSFVPKNREGLLRALRNTKDADGLPVFAEGSKQDKAHWDNRGDPNDWALRKSFSKTHGIGFREIWRPRLSRRPLSVHDDQPDRYHSVLDRRFSGNFNDPLEDITSLHGAVAADICNFHIDETGFVIEGGGRDIIVNPNSGQHTVNELFYKTNLDGVLPDWLVDRLSIMLPNSTNGYSRAGLSFDFSQRKSFRLRVTGSCSVLGGFDCSATVSMSGTHDLFGHK